MGVGIDVKRGFKTSPRTVRQQTPKIYEWHPSSHNHGSGKLAQLFRKESVLEGPILHFHDCGRKLLESLSRISYDFLDENLIQSFRTREGGGAWRTYTSKQVLGTRGGFTHPGFVRKEKKKRGSHSVRGHKTHEICVFVGAFQLGMSFV